MKCAYCKKPIDESQGYGVLGSGLIHHLDCYKEAFMGKGWKPFKFRVKNKVLYNISKFRFAYHFYKWVFFSREKGK